MSDDIAATIARLSQAQRNAVVASAVLVPNYRDAGRMHASLIELRLAKPVLGGVALTELGRRVRIELKGSRK